MTNNQGGSFLANTTVTIDKLHGNLPLHAVLINVDKLTLVLERHERRLAAHREIEGPASVIMTIILTFVTADFKDVGFPRTVWQALFLFILAVAIVKAREAYSHRRKAVSVDELVELVKHEAGTTTELPTTQQPADLPT